MSEFRHYSNHTPSARHADNCGACALQFPVIIDGKLGINYAAWPLSFLKNFGYIPNKFMKFLAAELKSENLHYVEHLKSELIRNGYKLDEI